MTEPESEGGEAERNRRQDKLLTHDEIARLKQAGIDIHQLKNESFAPRGDLYKDDEGSIYIKPKGGNSMGEETGLNINNF